MSCVFCLYKSEFNSGIHNTNSTGNKQDAASTHNFVRLNSVRDRFYRGCLWQIDTAHDRAPRTDKNTQIHVRRQLELSVSSTVKGLGDNHLYHWRAHFIFLLCS